MSTGPGPHGRRRHRSDETGCPCSPRRGLRPDAGRQPADRLLLAIGIWSDRALPGSSEPWNCVRYLGGPGSRWPRRTGSPLHWPSTPASASTPAALRRPGHPRLSAQRQGDGRGLRIEVAQSDSGRVLRLVPNRNVEDYERPADRGFTATPLTAAKGDRPVPAGCATESVTRSTSPRTGYILFMASEQEFWRNFCEAVQRPDLFDRWPGAEYGDHARGNHQLRAELANIFASRTTADWVAFGHDHNTTIAPVNTPQTISRDPPVRGPDAMDTEGASRRRHAPLSRSVRGRVPTPGPGQGAVRRPAHRRDPGRGGRLRPGPNQLAAPGRRGPVNRLATSLKAQSRPSVSRRGSTHDGGRFSLKAVYPSTASGAYKLAVIPIRS